MCVKEKEGNRKSRMEECYVRRQGAEDVDVDSLSNNSEVVPVESTRVVGHDRTVM